MKYFLHIILLMFIFSTFLGCKREVPIVENEERTDILRIYVQDSFANSDFFQQVINLFTELYDCTIELVTLSDEEKLLTQIIADRDSLRADLALGITNLDIYRAMSTNLFIPYEPVNLRNLRERNMLLDSRHRFIPIDYAYFAFIYDKEIVLDPPKTFGEFQSSVWHDRLIMMDPRTSVTGHGLLMWIIGLFGDRGFEIYWERVRRNIFTLYSSHEQAYIDFLTDIAPMMLTYNTTLLRTRSEGHFDRFESFIPEEGGFMEINYAAILDGSPNLFLARRFIDFMLTREIQQLLPHLHWRYPVISGVQLPLSFSEIPIPKNDLTETIHSRNALFTENWIETWINIIGIQ